MRTAPPAVVFVVEVERGEPRINSAAPMVETGKNGKSDAAKQKM